MDQSTKADIAFLQEAFSTCDIENEWKFHGEVKCCLHMAQIIAEASSF